MDRILTPIENAIIVVSFLGALVIGIAQVVLRYAFNTGFVWTEGALVTLTILGAMMGGSRAVARGMHVRIMLLVANLAPRARKIANMLGLGISIAFCAFMLYCGWLYVAFLRMTGNVTISMGVKTWIIFLIVPIVMVFFLLRYFERVRATWHGTEVNAEEFIE